MDITANFSIELYDAPHSSWVNITPWALNNTLEIDVELNARGTLSVELEDLETDVPMVPLRSMRIRVKDGSNTFFGGTLDVVEQEYADKYTGKIHYSLKALDYSRLLDRFPVNLVYSGMNAGNIVKALISKMPGAESVDVTNVELGPRIAKASFPNLTIQDAIDEVARVAGYKWYIGPDKKLYFFEPRQGVLNANWQLNAAAIAAGRFHIRAPRVVRETSQYRNLQEVIGGTTIDDQESIFPLETATGIPGTYEPGKTSEADMAKRWDVGKPINVLSRAYVSNTPYFKDRQEKKVSGSPGGGMFYYRQGERYVYLSDSYEDYAGVKQYAKDYAPRKGQYIWFEFKSQTQASARIEKTEEWCNSEGLAAEDTIYEMAQIEGGSGIYKKVEMNDNLKTSAECYERARALLIAYGKVPTVVRFESLNWGNLYPGKFQELNLYGYSNKIVTCQKMTIRDIDGCVLEASFELVGSERFSYLQYWRAIAGGQTPRMQSTYQVRADEIVTEHRGITDSLMIHDDLETDLVEVNAAQAWGTARFNDGGIWG